MEVELSVADEVSLKGLFERLIAAWNARSGDDFAAPFCEQADFVAFEGTHLSGRARIAAFHRNHFATLAEGSLLSGTVQFVRALGPDAALVHGHLQMTLPREPSATPSRNTMQLLVAERTPEGFRFRACLDARLVPPDRQAWWDQLEAVPGNVRRDVTEQVAQVARDRAAGPSRLLRASALVLAALSLTITSAHVLEMPQKMRLPPALYGEINGTLYRWFASVGGVYTMLAIGAAWYLTISARKTKAVFAKASIAAASMSAAFVSWLIVVLPVNRSIENVLSRHPADLPTTWMLLRPRWEYGHLIGFVFSLVGFCALAAAAVGDASNTRQRAVSD